MSFQMQQQIKHNAQEIRQYVTDLYDWQNEMQLKEKAKMRILKQQRQKEQEISEQLQREIQEKKLKVAQEDKQDKAKEKPKQLIRDASTVKDYYNAWDKFDVDKQIEKIEQEQLKPYKPYNPYQHSQNYVRAKPKAKINININNKRMAVVDPTQLKDKVYFRIKNNFQGNLHYKVCEYDRAIDAYSQCLQKLQQLDNTDKNDKLKCIVLSNRAMTYLKINERSKALKDCTQSLIYDDKYTKSYLRRAECHRKLGNYRDSLQDYRKIKEIDPSDKDIDIEITKIQAYLQKQVKQARQSLIMSSFPNPIPGSYRVPIQQTDQLPVDQVVQSTKNIQSRAEIINPLEQL